MSSDTVDVSGFLRIGLPTINRFIVGNDGITSVNLQDRSFIGDLYTPNNKPIVTTVDEVTYLRGHLKDTSENTILNTTGGYVTLTGTVNGNVKGKIKNSAGTVILDNTSGSVLLTGDMMGNICDTSGSVILTNTHRNVLLSGDVAGDLTGNIYDTSGIIIFDTTHGDVLLSGNVVGNLTGNVNGNLTGNVNGNLTGDLTGNIYDTTSAKIFTNTHGSVLLSGNVTGNLTGNVLNNAGRAIINTNTSSGGVLTSSGAMIIDTLSGSIFPITNMIPNLQLMRCITMTTSSGSLTANDLAGPFIFLSNRYAGNSTVNFPTDSSGSLHKIIRLGEGLFTGLADYSTNKTTVFNTSDNGDGSYVLDTTGRTSIILASGQTYGFLNCGSLMQGMRTYLQIYGPGIHYTPATTMPLV